VAAGGSGGEAPPPLVGGQGACDALGGAQEGGADEGGAQGQGAARRRAAPAALPPSRAAALCPQAKAAPKKAAPKKPKQAKAAPKGKGIKKAAPRRAAKPAAKAKAKDAVIAVDAIIGIKFNKAGKASGPAVRESREGGGAPAPLCDAERARELARHTPRRCSTRSSGRAAT